MPRVLPGLEQVALVGREQLGGEVVAEAVRRLVDAEVVERLADEQPDRPWRQAGVARVVMPAWEQRAVCHSGSLQVALECPDGLRGEVDRFLVIPPLPPNERRPGYEVQVCNVKPTYLH